jgi:hypothetical protein
VGRCLSVEYQCNQSHRPDAYICTLRAYVRIQGAGGAQHAQICQNIEIGFSRSQFFLIYRYYKNCKIARKGIKKMVVRIETHEKEENKTVRGMEEGH